MVFFYSLKDRTAYEIVRIFIVMECMKRISLLLM